MATKQRGLEVNIPDRENIIQKTGKDKINNTKLQVSRRPALGELGNRIHLHEQQNVKKSESLMGPPAAFKKPAKPVNQTASSENVPSTQENVSAKSKSEKPVAKVGPIQRQESILKVDCTGIVRPSEVRPYSTMQMAFIDPDKSSKDDPQMVVEYVADIFNYLKELEETYPIREKYLVSHQTTPRMRTVLVNWLIEVHSNFKMCLETLHMCVAIIDRYLQDSSHVGRETLQLVGTSALLVASKYEEMYIPDISDFVYICDDAFSSKQILDTEKEILKKLEFKLGRPLSIHFLRRYSKIARVEPEQHTLAKYILELALLEYELCHVRPSLQAAAACCLSIAIMMEVTDASKVWTMTMTHFTGYHYLEFKSLIISFAHLIKKAENSKYQAIRKKYSTAAYAKISLNVKLHGSLVKKLTMTTPPHRNP